MKKTSHVRKKVPEVVAVVVMVVVMVVGPI